MADAAALAAPCENRPTDTTTKTRNTLSMPTLLRILSFSGEILLRRSRLSTVEMEGALTTSVSSTKAAVHRQMSALTMSASKEGKGLSEAQRQLQRWGGQQHKRGGPQADVGIDNVCK